MIMDTGKSEECMMGQQTRDLGRTNVAIQIQRLSVAEFPLAQRRSVFCLIETCIWLDEAHPNYRGKPTLLQVPDLDVNLIQNNFTKTSGIKFDKIPGTII